MYSDEYDCAKVGILYRLALPRALWYPLRGLPLVASEFCPQRNSSFVITRGSDMPSAMDLSVRIP